MKHWHFFRWSLMLTLVLFVLVPSHMIYAQSGSIAITPDATQRDGQVGSVVFYTLTVSNTGATDVNLKVVTQGLNAWPVTTDPLTFTLAASGSRNVIVAVAVPATVANGATEVTTVQFLDAATNNGLGSVALTTRALVSPTPTFPPSGRPLVVMESYGIEEGGPIAPGQEFGLRLRMANVGRSAARDIIFTFSGEGFLPLNTGGCAP